MLLRQFILLAVTLVSIPTWYPPAQAQEITLNGTKVLLAQAAKDTLTEEVVEKLIEKVKAATKSRNIDALMSHFTPFTYTEFTVHNGSVSETVELTGLDEHRGFLQEIWKNVKSSEEVDDYLQIDLSDDGQTAVVRRTRLINLTLQDGRRLLVQSESKSRVAMLGQEPKIIAIQETAFTGPLP